MLHEKGKHYDYTLYPLQKWVEVGAVQGKKVGKLIVDKLISNQ